MSHSRVKKKSQQKQTKNTLSQVIIFLHINVTFLYEITFFQKKT